MAAPPPPVPAAAAEVCGQAGAETSAGDQHSVSVALRPTRRPALQTGAAPATLRVAKQSTKAGAVQRKKKTKDSTRVLSVEEWQEFHVCRRAFIY